MFKIIIPKAAFKELEKIDSENQKLIYLKIKDLEAGIFTADKALKGKHKIHLTTLSEQFLYNHAIISK